MAGVFGGFVEFCDVGLADPHRAFVVRMAIGGLDQPAAHGHGVRGSGEGTAEEEIAAVHVTPELGGRIDRGGQRAREIQPDICLHRLSIGHANLGQTHWPPQPLTQGCRDEPGGRPARGHAANPVGHRGVGVAGGRPPVM
jgi:hypothetical protein